MRAIFIYRQNSKGLEQCVGFLYNWDTLTEAFIDYAHDCNKGYFPPKLLTVEKGD